MGEEVGYALVEAEGVGFSGLIAGGRDVVVDNTWNSDGDGRKSVTGSSCTSGIDEDPRSEWRPMGLRGRRRVPLFGFGTIPKESHIML